MQAADAFAKITAQSTPSHSSQETAVPRVNEHHLAIKGSYLFSDIAKRVKAFGEANPSAKLIRLGIGDVTRPLAPAIVRAMQDAVAEMGRAETFRGYPPETASPSSPS